MRDAAAAQSPAIQLSGETPVEPGPDATFVYVPPVEVEPVKIEPPRLPTAAPESDGFLSALFEVLIETALDIEPDDFQEGQYESWLTCQSRADLKTTAMGYKTCPDR